MNAQGFLELFSRHPALLSVCEQLQLLPKARIHAAGLSGSATALTISQVFEKLGRTQLVILNDEEEAAYLRTDIENLTNKSVLILPESYKKSFNQASLDNSLVLQRAEVLSRVSREDEAYIIATWPQALCETVIARRSLGENTFQIKEGANFDLDFLMELLSEYEFDRVDFVYEAGQFSIRGGIIDVFSFGNELPYRIELNGDIVESIREFDPDDQLSVKRIKWANILPNIQKENIAEERVSFFEYLPANGIVWLKDTENLKLTIKEGEERSAKLYESVKEEDHIKPELLFENWESINKQILKRSLVSFGQETKGSNPEVFDFQTSPQPYFNKNFELIIQNIKEAAAKGYQTYIFSETNKQIERLYSIFADLDKTVEFQPVYKGLSEGFISHAQKMCCYTDHRLFDRYYRYKGRKAHSVGRALTLKELSELRPGDFVVHSDHGIGKFAGLEKIDITGVMQEAVRIVYRNDDLLYVHINSLHKISKYVGKDGTTPSLHKLGSDTWEKLKKSTKKKVKDIARDLIKLYALRKSKGGFAFSPDNYLQVELEASFIYEDTPDQSKATEDVKNDMMQPHPMDRLVCGDVGFGKTEVAIRAAFKAVCDSKQVAILVPTTILAQQHYKTFVNRLKDFPCNIDYINRFRSRKEQTEILKKLSEGRIDIIIGTHKLVSKETKFKDLGLLIIDEEQKFGVATKEKLKQFKLNVDTLTLTATPIPRTLHFSLMGARDLSVINTPPPNRQPVKTELHVFNRELIKEAIEHEMERGGQVFFIHSRVKDIQDIAAIISEECPFAKIGIAHGQMPGEALEDVMVKFVEGEYDVLVATTIIESGLDIPNANTIIINNAHMFGLSDLHQMRGRVGRSNKKAYCYLLSPPLSTLTSEARKRLSAIEQFSELGSGFNVAMRDLDIRGAGNLLGGEQSGFIAEIGFEMYQKILDEALRELKQEEFSGLFAEEKADISSTDCQVETDTELLIPDHYVRNIAERLQLYKELASLKKEEELEKFASELTDRFGPMPSQVGDLLDAVRLKWVAAKLGFEKVLIRQNRLTAFFPLDQESDYYRSELFGKLLRIIAGEPQNAKLKQTEKTLSVTFKDEGDIESATALFENMNSLVHAIQ